MKGYEGQIAASISMAIMTFFTNFNISRLWMNQSAWNWWSNWRVFAALADGKKIFDQYFPQIFLEIVEAGAKKSIFLQIGQFWMKNLATSNFKKHLKSMSKIKYCSRAN